MTYTVNGYQTRVELAAEIEGYLNDLESRLLSVDNYPPLLQAINIIYDVALQVRTNTSAVDVSGGFSGYLAEVQAP